jgi:hypothetical protein
MSELSLEQKVDRLFAIDAIKQLKYQYCRYCDTGYDADGVASLFIEDGLWDGGETFGRYAGRDAIRKGFGSFAKEISFAAHLVINPIITVDGDEARGRWWLLEPLAARQSDGGVQGRWLIAEYEEEYVRQSGTWKFRSMKIHSKAYAPYLDDWAQHLMTAPTAA